MDKKTFSLLEAYMQSCVADNAHDAGHIYRVLYQALEIAKTEDNVNADILIAACLLHDIGRGEQIADRSLCHAEVGAEKAYRFLLENGFLQPFAQQVSDCILTHRFRKNRIPQSIEAKILFDADKLDVVGAMGLARTLMSRVGDGGAIYQLRPDGSVSDGTDDEESTLFKEYKRKLEVIYDRFYTTRGRQIALQRQEAAKRFYEDLLQEIRFSYDKGPAALKKHLLDQ